MKDKVFKEVTVEISDKCNAKCKWCSTGRKARPLDCKTPYMTPELFRVGLERLQSLGRISRDTAVELYNWGEPFLNLDLDAILTILAEKGLPSHLSTNGSVYRKISENSIRYMDYLMFSLSGMSEATYGRIHGLNLEQVLKNIEKTVLDFAKLGYESKIRLNFHIYQFNLHEVEQARKFCQEIGIQFVPTYAYINDFKLFNSYLRKELSAEEYTAVSTELLTYPYFETAQRQPKDYQCPQWNKLVFDHRFHLVPCCRLTSGEALCSVFDEDFEEKLEEIPNSEYCRECLSTGQSYIIHEGELYPKWYHETILPQSERMDALLKEMEVYRSTFKQYQTDLDTLKTALEQRAKDVSALEAALEQRAKDVGTLEAALEQKSEDVNTLETALEQRSKDVRTLETELEQQTENINKLMCKLKRENDLLATAESKLGKITSEYQTLSRSFLGKIALKLSSNKVEK